MRTDDREAWAEAAEVCACFNLRRAARAVTRLFDEVLEPGSLRATQFAPMVVIRASGEPSLPRLAKSLGVDRSSLTRNLQPLVRAGLVKTSSSAGRRSASARLTPKGVKALDRCLPLWRDAQARFEKRVGAARWRAVLQGVTAIVTALPEA